MDTDELQFFIEHRAEFDLEFREKVGLAADCAWFDEHKPSVAYLDSLAGMHGQGVPGNRQGIPGLRV
jgi:hypothetical protein